METQEGAALLDGKAVSAIVLEELRSRIQRENLTPHLHVIIAGDDVASQVFVRQKRLAADKIGVIFSQTNLDITATLQELQETIVKKNLDPGVHGIIVQLPLPESLREHERTVLDLVDPAKDVDCFHPLNFGQLAQGTPRFLPATPAGICRLLRHYGVETKGKLCVILGKSNIVGKPLGLLLAHEAGPAATVVFCDQYTERMWDLTRQADILVVAAGKHHLVRDPSVLRADGKVVVIDVGIHRVQTPEGKTVVQGDVDAEVLRPHCRWITPVPGGIGPMTVACLLEQVVEAASCLSDPLAQLKHAFKRYDAANHGFMHPEELSQLMAQLDPSFPVGGFEAALSAMSVDCSGRVAVEDFLSWIYGGREK